MVMSVQAKVLPRAFFEQVSRHAGRVALRYKNYGIWQKVMWDEYGSQVRQVAAGLVAANLAPGETACILVITGPSG